MRRLAVLCCLLTVAILAATSAHAQSRPLSGGTGEETPLRPATRTVALTNARVVVAPGRVLERATVVVRDGRIVSVGSREAVPFDARRIAADSLTVYAGFVDAFSTAGVAAPADAERYTGDPGSPPRERAGVTPDRDVRATFDATDARIAALRAAGFTLAHVVPRDGLFSGRGALVSLRAPERGEPAGGLFVSGIISLVARIAGARGVYPATPMGALAVMRGAVENARRRQDARGADAAFDPVADALDDVIAGDLPFWFVADDPLTGFRALRASREMDLSPILAGVTDVRPLLETIRADRVPVVLSLALPDTVAADSLSLPPMRTPSGSLAAVRLRRTRDYRDVPAERAATTETRRTAIARADAAAAMLAEARVPFALGTFATDADDLLPNLRRLVAAGLSADDALAALTTQPARLFDIERLAGTVEEGRLAHLVVTDGPLFADSTRIRYVLVDGVVHEIPRASRTRSDAADTAAVVAVGTWRYEGPVPDGVRGGTFVISRAGASLSGTLIADGAPYALSAVALDGDALSFDFTTLGGDTARVRGTIDGDTFVGTVEGLDGAAVSIVATRLPG